MNTISLKMFHLKFIDLKKSLIILLLLTINPVFSQTITNPLKKVWEDKKKSDSIRFIFCAMLAADKAVNTSCK